MKGRMARAMQLRCHLMLTVERAFNTKFAAAEIAGLQNVGDLVSVVKRHCAA
jgi:acyl carrier protein